MDDQPRRRAVIRNLKGVVELLARRVAPHAAVSVRPSDVGQFVPGRGAEVLLDGELWGWLGNSTARPSRRSICGTASAWRN